MSDTRTEVRVRFRKSNEPALRNYDFSDEVAARGFIERLCADETVTELSVGERQCSPWQVRKILPKDMTNDNVRH